MRKLLLLGLLAGCGSGGGGGDGDNSGGAPEYVDQALQGKIDPLIGREKEYRLTAKLFRSKLVIEDRRGNKIAVKKRSRVIMVERWPLRR